MIISCLISILLTVAVGLVTWAIILLVLQMPIKEQARRRYSGRVTQ